MQPQLSYLAICFVWFCLFYWSVFALKCCVSYCCLIFFFLCNSIFILKLEVLYPVTTFTPFSCLHPHCPGQPPVCSVSEFVFCYIPLMGDSIAIFVFLAWLILLSITPSGFTHVVMNGRMSFLRLNSIPLCVDHIAFTHSSVYT